MKHTIFFLMKREKQITINLVMLLLKVEAEVVKVLVVSIHHLSQIYSKTFLVILVVEDQVEDLAIEVMT